MSFFTNPLRSLFLAAGCLVAAPLTAQFDVTCAGYVLSDNNSLRLLDLQGGTTFHLVFGNYPTANILPVGPRLIVKTSAGTYIMDRSGTVMGGIIANLGNYQTTRFADDRVAVVDYNQVRIYDLDGGAQGSPIMKSGTQRQRVEVGAGRIVVVDESEVRIFDRQGQQVGASIPRTGSTMQGVRTTAGRIVVTDDYRVQIFDQNGQLKGAPIHRTGTNRQAVKLDGDRVVVVDDDRVRIFDQEGTAQGASILNTGANTQQVQFCEDRMIVVDNDRVRVFDRNGAAIGAPVINGTPSYRQWVTTTQSRIIVRDGNRTEIFDKNMVAQGAPITKTGFDAQFVVASDDRILVTDQDRSRIFDNSGAQQGGPIMKTGFDQWVRIKGNRITVTDDDQVRVFDLGGAQVGASIAVTYVEEYDVLLFDNFITVVDNFSTVTIYDRNANQQGQPISVGYGVQHVQATEDRILIIDANLVRLFDENGAQVGSSVTTAGDPDAQALCYSPGDLEYYGTACAGAVQIAYGEARVGGTTSYALSGAPANTLALMGIGFGRLQAPLDLGTLGAPGCLVYSDIAVSHPLVTSSQGLGTIYLDLPNNQAFVGTKFTTQFFVLAPPANSLGVVTSDAVETTFGQGV